MFISTMGLKNALGGVGDKQEWNLLNLNREWFAGVIMVLSSMLSPYSFMILFSVWLEKGGKEKNSDWVDRALDCMWLREDIGF